MSKDLICNKHDKAIEKLDKIMENVRYALKHYKNDLEYLTSLLDDIDSDAWDIKYIIEEAKESGQSMESRLKEYREKIESLGFTR